MKSFFGQKEKDSSSPPMPQLPSQREIIEDIENIQKNDPILSLASILDKQGRHSVVDTDITELTEALKRRRRRESSSSSATAININNSPLFSMSMLGQKSRKDSFKSSSNSTPKKISNSNKNPPPHSKESSNPNLTISGPNEAEQTLNYDKLKHFLTTCQHSQEIVEKIEVEIKNFYTEIMENSKIHPNLNESLT